MENGSGLSVLTWNINGIRSFQEPLEDVLNKLGCDIVCLQETKISRHQLGESFGIIDGYNAYYSCSKVKGGYSGVATICKNSCKPVKASEGITGILSVNQDAVKYFDEIHEIFAPSELKRLDYEGRCMITEHIVDVSGKEYQLIIINVYCPRHDHENPIRFKFKLDFLTCLRQRTRTFIENGYKVVIVGDLNIAHKEIDHCEALSVQNFRQQEDRLWLDAVINPDNKHGMVDAFRFLNPTKINAYTCWNTKLDSRKLNHGTRIDYVLLSNDMKESLNSCEILSVIEGSDHCPVKAHLSLRIRSANNCPSICSKFYPEFQGRQEKLTAFLVRGRPPGQLVVETDTKKPNPKQTKIATFFVRDTTKADTTEKIVSDPVYPPQRLAVAGELKGPWKEILGGNKPVPNCSGHNEQCQLITVKKKGPNFKRKFYCCSRGVGPREDPNSRCKFFKWY